MYNVDDKFHTMYKDNILKDRFKTLIETIINQNDEELNKESDYYNFLKYLLRSIMTLSSDNTRLELNTLISKYLIGSNCSHKASAILESIINSNDLTIPLRITFR